MEPTTITAEYLESELLRAAGFRHAFFTRRGGVSEGAFSSLNFSIGVGDTPERVKANFELAGRALGVPGTSLFFLSQVHGTETQVIGSGAVREHVAELEGDALLSQDEGIGCGVRTADCVPVLLADQRSGAVAAIHAGWRGVVRGVVEAGVRKLQTLAEPNAALIAVIGPHIGPQAFEIGADVALEIEQASPVANVIARDAEKPRADLARVVRAKLRALGLADAAIEQVPGCTVSDPERFFSFRRDGKRGGRHLSVIISERRQPL